MNSKLFNFLSTYLKQTGISVSKSRLNQLLTSHPESNSMYTIVDVLDALNIDNVTLSLDLDNFRENGFPAIVHTKEGGGNFIVVEDIIEDNVYYYNTEVERSVKTIKEFSAKWSGIALYAAQNEIQAEMERKKIKTTEKLLRWRTPLAIFAGLSCFIAWGFAAAWTITLIIFFSLCALGLAVSILLTLHDLGESNHIIHKVCHLNRITNCNAVLSSSASNLFGWLSMSDIGLCYFSGSAFSLIFAGVASHLNETVSWLFILAICSFPYTVFSLSYQLLKVKKICPMCIAIIIVLWAEIALAIINLPNLILLFVSPVAVFSLLTGFSLPVITWAYVKPLLKEYNRIRDYEFHYIRLKRTPEVIHAMLTKERGHNMEFSEDEIHLGKVSAPVHITVVLSYYCQPCINTWTVLNRWLTVYSTSLRLTVRFSGYDYLGVEIQKLINSLTWVYRQNGNEVFREALTYWYEIRDFQKWGSKYLTSSLSIEPQLSTMKNAKWEQINSIVSIPTLFFSDRIFPFEVIDLEYMLKLLEINKD